MLSGPATASPTLSTTTSSASPTSTPRPGRLRGLSYLRNYTQNSPPPSNSAIQSIDEVANAILSGSNLSLSDRFSIVRSRTRNSQPIPSQARRASSEDRSTEVNTAQISASGWLPSVGGSTGPSRSANNLLSTPLEPQSTQRSAFSQAESTGPSMIRHRSATTPTRTSLIQAPREARTASASYVAMLNNSLHTSLHQVASPNGEPGAVLSSPNEDWSKLPMSQLPSIKFVPYQDSRTQQRPSLTFPPVSRTIPSPTSIIRVGRYSEREGAPTITSSRTPSDAPIGFKSKVVSRRHCEFFYNDSQWYVKDVKSSSGTFLNHIRLSQPGVESKPYAVKDGDLIQLGIDFKGGEESHFRCVKIRVYCNRGWQKSLNKFNQSAHKHLQELAKGKGADKEDDQASKYSTECTICLNSIAPCQSLFVAPCSHTWHYKCIRRFLEQKQYPHFECPNCRAVADLEADIEDPQFQDDIDEPEIQAFLREAVVDEGNRTTPNGNINGELQGDHTTIPDNHMDMNGSNGDLPLDATPPTSAHMARVNSRRLNPDATSFIPATTQTQGPGQSPSEDGQENLDVTRRVRSISSSEPRVLSPDGGPLTPRNNAGPFVLDNSDVVAGPE